MAGNCINHLPSALVICFIIFTIEFYTYFFILCSPSPDIYFTSLCNTMLSPMSRGSFTVAIAGLIMQ